MNRVGTEQPSTSDSTSSGWAYQTNPSRLFSPGSGPNQIFSSSGLGESLSAIVDAEFAVDVLQVLLHGASGDDEVLSRLSIGDSLGYEI